MYKPVALGLTIVGIVLLLIGLGSAESIQKSFSQLFTRHHADHTMWLVVGGSICLIAGIFGYYRSRRD